jgi:hypothetical protein
VNCSCMCVTTTSFIEDPSYAGGAAMVIEGNTFSSANNSTRRRGGNGNRNSTALHPVPKIPVVDNHNFACRSLNERKIWLRAMSILTAEV